MKLVRYGAKGKELPGIIDSDGNLRSLAGLVNEESEQFLSDKGLAELGRMNLSKLPLVPGKPRFGCPVANVSKFVAIGLNYTDHAKETNSPIPKEPIIFMKALNCLQGPNDNVMLPRGSVKTDWEVELGIVISKKTRYVTKGNALDHVAGYVLVNDVSEREFQAERGPQWDKGKGCDTFGPVGPYLVTRDEVKDPQNLELWLDVNGKRMQTGNTRTMIFPVKEIISYVSEFMTLFAGDIITTGTPPGVGSGMKPQVFLKAGDVMTLGISGLGEQRQTVVPFKL
ncbi:MAG: fumarylacetoacetate hydrolase family protein [Deltaproteobacteria bacterium]|jgi:2,4-didehydro-3-deoxy-L-rhamnonate hydrolase|nr:fumarylacetoacetate hydrolase family protein [Deltaproteobacteria bacterium]MBT7203594.1 fumarylacetoacetate hydrolase family protein [Deltaproteobacteria bacterium]